MMYCYAVALCWGSFPKDIELCIFFHFFVSFLWLIQHVGKLLSEIYWIYFWERTLFSLMNWRSANGVMDIIPWILVP